MRWIFLFLIFQMSSCGTNPGLFESIRSESEIIDQFLSKKDKYEVQIRYTRVDRDAEQKPMLTSYSFNYDSTRYFYPASTVKMPVAFLALQKANELGISKDDIMRTDSSRAPQTTSYLDSTSIDGLPSIGHYIEKVFAISDNDAYNRLYEFCGQDYINAELQKKGIATNSRIVTRVGVGGYSTEDNRHTNPVSFFDRNENLVYKQEGVTASGNYFQALSDTKKGKGFYVDDLDTIIYESFDMSEKNFLNLRDLEASLLRVIFPQLYSEDELYDFEDDDYKFLYQTMNKRPKEFDYLKDHSDSYYDSYVKFFLFGDSENQMPDHIKIFNKVGFAYGYLTDCAYIIDIDNGVEFFLTATVHVNDNQIYNDGNYEYDQGIQFLAELGRAIYQQEKNREKKYLPDFTRFMISD